MDYLQLFINDLEVDLPPKTKGLIRVSKSVAEAQDIESRSGEHTYSLELPPTRRNDKIFGLRRNAQVLDKFNNPVGYAARLVVNGQPFLEGLFRLSSTNGTTGYKGAIYTDAISWVQLLGEKKLTDIKSFAPVPFIGVDTLQEILAKDCDSTDLQFPLISYGNFYNETPDQPLNSVFGPLHFEDYPPSVYRLNIIRKIFQDIGWQVEGKIFSDPERRKECQVFTGKEYKWNWKYWGEANLNHDGTTLTKTGDPLGWFTYDNNPGRIEFRASATTRYQLTGTGAFYNTLGSTWDVGFSIQVREADGETLIATYDYLQSTPNLGQPTISFSLDIDLKKGEKIFIFLEGQRYNWEVNVALPDESDKINIAPNLPDLTQKEYLKAWLLENNLLWEVDPGTRTIRFIYRDEYVLPADFAIDLSNYADSRNNTYEPATDVRRFLFVYAEDSDDALYPAGYNYEYLNPQREATSEKTISSVIAPVTMRNYQFVVDGPLFALPTLASKEQLETKPEEVSWDFNYTPRVVKYEGLSPEGIEINYMDSPIRFGTASPIRKWSEIFEQHYRKFITTLARSEIVTNEFALSPALYSRLHPSVPVRFGPGLYELNKISSFDLTDETSDTEIELIRIV